MWAPRKISYYIGMKLLLPLLLLFAWAPLRALNAQPDHDPVLQVYSTDKAENTRRAIRLGYQHFQTRLNTPEMTNTDKQIALFIRVNLQPFFDKLNALENASAAQKAAVHDQYNEEFNTLVKQLTQLFFKNQTRYTNPLFLDNQAALLETVDIIQEAADNGHF